MKKKSLVRLANQLFILVLILGLFVQNGIAVSASQVKKNIKNKNQNCIEGQEKPLNILQIGDSNTMTGYFTLNMREILRDSKYDTGTGFFSLNPDEYFYYKKLENVQITNHGTWKRFDMASNRKHCLIDNAPNGAYIQGSGKDSTYTIQFFGSALDIYYHSDVNAGEFQAVIDGKTAGLVETDKFGDGQIHVESFNNLGYTKHTMEIKIKDDRPVRLDGADAIGIKRENRTTIHTWGNSGASTKDYAYLNKTIFESGLKAVHPNEVVILLGTNDVGSPAPDNEPEAVEKNLVTILKRVKEALPDAEIWLLSTLETDGDNVMLHKYESTSLPNAAKEVGVNYWSMGEFNGKFDPDKMVDGAHVNDKGGKPLMQQLYSKMLLKRKIDSAKSLEKKLGGYGDKVTSILKNGIDEAEKIHLNSLSTKEEVDGQTKGLDEEMKLAEQSAQDVEDHKKVPRPNILDIDFNEGTAFDQTFFAHDMQILGSPVIKEDKELGRKVAEFDGEKDAFSYKMSNIDYEIFKQGYTLDCMVKLEDQEQNGAIFSNLENGAIGLMTGKSIIRFSEKHNGLENVNHGICQNQWNHLVAASDGKTMKLYINGKLKDTMDSSKDGELNLPDRIEKFFTLGADSEDGQKVINPSKVMISSAGIFSRALTDEEVKRLYWQEEKTEIVLPSSAQFNAIEGEVYKVPEASVKTATGEKAEVKVGVKDSQGNKIDLAEGEFKVKADEYRILYEANGKSIEKILKVSEKKEEVPQVDQEKIMEEGQQSQITINNQTKDAKVSCVSENPQIASVNSNGLVHANKAGQTTIKFSIQQSGHTYNLTINISVKARPGVISERLMTEGDSYGITIQNKDTNAHVAFTSLNPAVASINGNGLVHANKAGETEIRITVDQAGNVHTLTTKIIVRGKYKEVVKPSVNIIHKTLLANTGFKISVNHRVTGAQINFKSGNKGIACVSKFGYVKGLKTGKTLIITTVKQCGKVFILKTDITVNGYVKFVKAKRTIKRKKSYTFKAKACGTGTSLKWSVSNKKFGKISKKGKFTANKKKGKVYVIVRSGKYREKILVNIK